VIVPGLIDPLTARELEVLRLLATGTPNRAIAEQLVVTQETVKKHLSHIFDKLGAGTAPKPSSGRGSWDCCPDGTASSRYHVG
jgi:DNA-binding CsgD family transcriptional regulator